MTKEHLLNELKSHILSELNAISWESLSNKEKKDKYEEWSTSAISIELENDHNFSDIRQYIKDSIIGKFGKDSLSESLIGLLSERYDYEFTIKSDINSIKPPTIYIEENNEIPKGVHAITLCKDWKPNIITTKLRSIEFGTPSYLYINDVNSNVKYSRFDEQNKINEMAYRLGVQVIWITPPDANPNKLNHVFIHIFPQRLIQGPPGTGKSYRINQDLDKLKAKSTRIVCHPESTNAQFIGSYRPQSQNGQITYAFSPGPFIKLLAEALKDQDTPHVLVIEELNRANSAAMFAEAFQLLDRVGSGDKEGWSEHPTDLGDDVLDYLKRELGEEHEEYQRALKEGVRLPPNFAIWATMNTADQGVFPMDTAFKRRWSFEHLGVDEEYKTWLKDPWNPQLPTAGVPWQTFRVALNHALEQLEVEEDRLIGPFFLNERELQDPETNVVGKVLSYLRDDVLRYEPKGLFVGVNDKGEPSSEGRAPSFAWLKRQHTQTQTGLLSLFKGELSASLEFAKSWIKAREDELKTQEAQEPTVQSVLGEMSDAQTPHNTSEEHPTKGEP